MPLFLLAIKTLSSKTWFKMQRFPGNPRKKEKLISRKTWMPRMKISSLNFALFCMCKVCMRSKGTQEWIQTKTILILEKKCFLLNSSQLTSIPRPQWGVTGRLRGVCRGSQSQEKGCEPVDKVGLLTACQVVWHLVFITQSGLFLFSNLSNYFGEHSVIISRRNIGQINRK